MTSTTVIKNVLQKQNLYHGILPRIGLEVHAQLSIKSKLFSLGANSSTASPNSQLDLFDISLPGTLPKLNLKAIKAAITTALALNCQVQDEITFDRKNYFYADMPAGFQLTQYSNPIAKNGYIDFIVSTYNRSRIANVQNYDIVKCLFAENRYDEDDIKPYIKRSQIKQIQLEQDSAKTLQYQDDTLSLIDYNRSGVALIEIVFEPDLENHHEASAVIRDLIATLKSIGTCDGELQQGSIRVDANVSIEALADGQMANSARVELKNLNSLRALNKGINHEVLRQAKILSGGGQVVQETRTFDTKSGKTVPLRLKVDSTDYRYFSEPSIPPLEIENSLIERSPKILAADFLDIIIKRYQLDYRVVVELTDVDGLAQYYLEVVEGDHELANKAAEIADFLIYTMKNLEDARESQVKFSLQPGSDFMSLMGPSKFSDIYRLIVRDEINYSAAYWLIKQVSSAVGEPLELEELIKQHSLSQINDDESIDALVNDLSQKMPGIFKKYRKKRENRFLQPMLASLCEKTDGRVNVKKAVGAINSLIDQ